VNHDCILQLHRLVLNHSNPYSGTLTAMMPIAPDRTERLQFDISLDLLRAIDDFQFRSRIPNRSEAVRELLKRGLAIHISGKE
jgi:hypothetical protein